MEKNLNSTPNHSQDEQTLYLSIDLDIQDYLKEFCDFSKDKILKEVDSFFKVISVISRH